MHFAVNASYTRVLTKEYTNRQRDVLAQPVKNPKINSHILFDSLADNTAAPTIFAVFGDSQAYPAYLSTYH